MFLIEDQNIASHQYEPAINWCDLILRSNVTKNDDIDWEQISKYRSPSNMSFSVNIH